MNAMSRPPLQFVFIVLLVLAIYLAIDFSQRISTSMQLAALEKQYAAERLRLEQINRDLNEKKKQVNTAAFVEKYVRENWHWVTDTDTLVLTSAAPADKLPATPLPAAPIPADPPWWQAIFDSLRFLLP
jgi:regulatory protein YycI of two-component signal transduction system YycFG